MVNETNYAGIDYGHGKTNVDLETGIRYGVIAVSDTEIDWDFDTEMIYNAHCPHCGSDCDDTDVSSCDQCGEEVDDSDWYGDEPDGINLTGDYVGHIDGSNEAWVIKSPYYTHAQFCSPCAPGAGHLGNPCKDGPATYCFGHDMFPGSAPYPVYSVETGELVVDVDAE